MVTVTFKNERTDAVVRQARRAAEFGAYERAVDLLADADGLEAWAFAGSDSPSRSAIAATIKHIRSVQRRAANRERAAEALAAEFGTDANEWNA